MVTTVRRRTDIEPPRLVPTLTAYTRLVRRTRNLPVPSPCQRNRAPPRCTGMRLNVVRAATWLASCLAASVVVVPAVADTPSCNGRPATVVGTDGADEIVGTAGPDVIVGGAGDDTIYGLGGDDVICAYGDADDNGATGADYDDLLFGGA